MTIEFSCFKTLEKVFIVLCFLLKTTEIYFISQFRRPESEIKGSVGLVPSGDFDV